MNVHQLSRPLILMVMTLLLGCAASDESAPAASEGSASWEPGEWAFDAEIEPWPPEAGSPVTLRAIARIDDYDESFSGSVSYKLVSSSISGSWIRMTPAGSDEGDMIYEATVTLPDERVGIHFLVSRANDGTTHELTDWSVTPG